jgi:DNA-binding PadR family transcriptional regulator
MYYSARDRGGCVGTNLPSDFEQQVLLAVWRLGDAAYGTSVRDEIESRTGRTVAQGAVYVTLVRLEKKGLLRSRLSDPTPVRGGKAKRYFEILPEGIEGVTAARETLERLWEGLADTARG